MKRIVLLPALMCVVFGAAAQVRSDRPIELNGTPAADRQVTGIADAASPDDALNASSLRAGGYLYAEVSGDAWQASLTPTAAPVSGMRLMLHVANANMGPVTLAIDGSPAYPVLANGDQPLLAGDVGAGSTVSVVFDGAAFQLISARRIERKPCPSGTVQVNELYCIEAQQHDTLEFPDAANVCGSLGMKLCSWAQFYNACYHAAELGLTDMVGDWEWTDDAANSDNSVRVTGQSSCTQISVTVAWGVAARNFHCCFKR